MSRSDEAGVPTMESDGQGAGDAGPGSAGDEQDVGWFETLDTPGDPSTDASVDVPDRAPAEVSASSAGPPARPPVTSVRLPGALRTEDAPAAEPDDGPSRPGPGDDDTGPADQAPERSLDRVPDPPLLEPDWSPPDGPPPPLYGDGSPVPPPPERRSRARRAVRPTLVTLLVLGLVVGVYVGAAALLADRVPFNTTIGGVDVGGLTSAEAAQRVTDEYADRAVEPVDVTVGPSSATLDPAAAGLAPDPATTVASVTGFSLAPADMWRHVVGAGRLPVDVAVDSEALEAALSDLAAQVDQAPVEGDVVLSGGVAAAVTPAPGRELRTAAAADALREQWLTDERPVQLPSTEITPEVDQAAVDAALAEATQVLAEDLTVVVAERRVVVPPQLFGDGLGYEPDGDGGLRLVGDGEALRGILLSRDPDVERAPVDASVTIRNGAPVVVPGADGVAIDTEELAEEAAAAALGDRVAELEAALAEPEVTTADVEALGIVELVSEFATPYPSNAARTENLRVATATINGTIVRPGEEFSLNAALGERTLEKGYRPAGVISNGRYSEGVGGGVSQVSTTLYNAAFFAGLEDVEHKPHSFYISRYPEGREATLNWDPPVEMIFRNNTPHGVLIESFLADGQVHVRMWSTTYWEVEESTSGRSNIRQPETVYDTSPDCESQAPSIGFDVTVTRVLKRNGQEVERESDTWAYSAADRIICGPPPGPDPQAGGDG